MNDDIFEQFEPWFTLGYVDGNPACLANATEEERTYKSRSIAKMMITLLDAVINHLPEDSQNEFEENIIYHFNKHVKDRHEDITVFKGK